MCGDIMIDIILTSIETLERIKNDSITEIKKNRVQFNKHGLLITSYARNNRINCLETQLNRINNSNLNSKATYQDKNEKDYYILSFLLELFDKKIYNDPLLSAYSNQYLFKHHKKHFKDEFKLMKKYNII